MAALDLTLLRAKALALTGDQGLMPGVAPFGRDLLALLDRLDAAERALVAICNLADALAGSDDALTEFDTYEEAIELARQTVHNTP